MAITNTEIMKRLLPGSLTIDGHLIGRHGVTDFLRSTWALHSKLVNAAKITYFMRSWEGSYLRGQVKEGKIFYQGEYYNVVWNVMPEEACRAASVLLSFRGSDTYGRYVIIRIKGEY